MANLGNAAVISLSVTLTLLTVLVIAIVVVAVHHSAWWPGGPRSGSGSSGQGKPRLSPKASEARLSTPRLRRYSGSKLIGRDPLQESINWSNSSGSSGGDVGRLATKHSRSVDSLLLLLLTPSLPPSKQLVPLSCRGRCHSVDVGIGGRRRVLLTASETVAVAAAVVAVEADVLGCSR